MASALDLRNAIKSELVAVLDEYADVEEPAAHVSELNTESEPQYPGIGFELFGNPRRSGLGSHGYVHESTYVNGVLDTATVHFPMRADLDIGVFAAGSQSRSTTHDAVTERFDTLIETPELLHEHVESIDDDGFTPAGRPSDSVAGVRTSFVVDYVRVSKQTDVAAMDEVVLRLEDLDTGTLLSEHTIN